MTAVKPVRVMRARRDSTCAACRRPIRIGQQIARPAGGTWTHVTCHITAKITISNGRTT